MPPHDDRLPFDSTWETGPRHAGALERGERSRLTRNGGRPKATDIPPEPAKGLVMPFELRDHTADIGVAATGENLGAVFAAVADGLAAASCESIPEAGSDPEGSSDSFELSVTAESREALLFDYLDELIYLRDVRLELPADNQVTITEHGEWRLEGRARGIPLSEITAREIKAVTYSEMRLAKRDGGWEAYVVFDV